jgi:hypothetical protein
MRILLFVFSVLLPLSSFAAVPTYQDRDEPGRNPYQDTAVGLCSNKSTCTMQFAKISAGERAVILNVSCDATSKKGYSGLRVQLGTAANKTTYTTFFALPYGNDYFGDFPANWQTLFYVDGPAAPAITLSSGYQFLGPQSCFLSGYTVALP